MVLSYHWSVPLCVQIEALKQMTRDELVSWFKEHRGQSSRKLSVHVSNAFVFMLHSPLLFFVFWT